MRIAHLSDLHIGGTGGKAGMPLAEQRDLLMRISSDISRQRCEFVLLGGDLFDSKSTTPEERSLAVDFLLTLPRSVTIVGNHEHTDDVALVTKAARSEFTSRPESTMHNGFTICCLPWPSRSRLAKWGGDSASIDGRMTMGLKAILDGLRAVDGPKILLAHLDVSGAKWDGGQEAVGQPVSVTPHDLEGFDYVALGHYHRMQKVSEGVWYAGCPRQMRFGDDEHKGYLIYDTETREVTVREIPSRRLWTMDLGWNGTKLIGESETPDVREGDVVRMRYQVPEEDRESARGCAEILSNTLGIIAGKVIVEPKIIAKAQVRSEGMVKAKTLPEKLEALWETDGRPKRAEQIKAKLEAIA